MEIFEVRFLKDPQFKSCCSHNLYIVEVNHSCLFPLLIGRWVHRASKKPKSLEATYDGLEYRDL